MAALLAEACRQIERSTPPAALVSIEQRLEQIATRLDQEIARPSASAAIDPGPFDDLARRIDSVRQSLEARPAATIDAGPIEKLLREFDAKLDAAAHADAGAEALQSIFIEIRDKLDRLADGDVGARQLEPALRELGVRLGAMASPIDLNPIETLLRSLEAKFDASAAAPVDREVVEQVADEVARRLHDINSRQTDLEAVAQQIDTIYDRIDALAAKATANDPGPVVRELLEKLREADKAEGSSALETSAAVHAALDAHLSELKAEQASADRRTQSRLADLQGVLETLTARLASIESELAADDVDEELRPPTRPASPATAVGSVLPGVEALDPKVAPQRASQSKAAASADDPTSQSASGEDFLIEPGAGAPQHAREARELAQMIGPKTNPSVSVHIAAARRAAQAALAENSAAPNSGVVKILTGSERAPFAARGVQTARAFYASHKRTVLLGVAVAIAATLAVRMAGVRAPFLQRSELGGQAVDTAKVEAPKGKPTDAAGAAKSGGRSDRRRPDRLDRPTAGQAGCAPNLAPESGPSASELIATIPPGISPPLRDAVAADQPAAQYELATRLFEGRGLPKDQPAAARWFERAASLGLAPAQYRLGSMYEKGIGVTPDPAAAKRWYLKAAEAGNARAAHNLAVMDTDSGMGEPDYPEATKWFRKAAEFGVRDSQYNLAILYARGLGVEKNLGQSFLWFSLAAQQGDTDAAKKRDEIAGQMDPASLASAVEALMKFRTVKPDPAANDVAAPPGGWDAKSDSLRSIASRRGSPAKRLFDRNVRRRDDPFIAVPTSRDKAQALPQGRPESPARQSRPRLRLRLLGLTDLHANLYPYDYYRDCPDDSVGLARAASLIAEARGEAPNCLLFDNGDILQGTPLGDFAAETTATDPKRDPPRHRRHEHARLCGRDARQPRFQLWPRGPRARLCPSPLSRRLLQCPQKRRLALVSAFDRDRARVRRRVRNAAAAQSGRVRRRAAADRPMGRGSCPRALDHGRHRRSGARGAPRT